MNLITHTARQFANALKALLPPGNAWNWSIGSLGDSIMLYAAAELLRLELAIQLVLNNAINTHRPAETSWHIDEYRRVAFEALGNQSEALPRQAFIAGQAKAGKRLWTELAPTLNYPISLLQVDHLIGPFLAGQARAGDLLMGVRSRYIIRVRYYDSVVNPAPIAAALNAFKQAHAFLWFEDITGRGGNISYA